MQAKENVKDYKKMVDHGTQATQDQMLAKEEEANTKTFTYGEYATLCRGNTSKVKRSRLLSFRDSTV